MLLFRDVRHLNYIKLQMPLNFAVLTTTAETKGKYSSGIGCTDLSLGLWLG